MFEWIGSSISGVLENQLAVPQFLWVIHWWFGAVVTFCVSLSGVVLLLWGLLDGSEAGCLTGIVGGLVLFFLIGPLAGMAGIYLIPAFLLILGIIQWFRKWRFIGWRKF